MTIKISLNFKSRASSSREVRAPHITAISDVHFDYSQTERSLSLRMYISVLINECHPKKMTKCLFILHYIFQLQRTRHFRCSSTVYCIGFLEPCTTIQLLHNMIPNKEDKTKIHHIFIWYIIHCYTLITTTTSQHKLLIHIII